MNAAFLLVSTAWLAGDVQLVGHCAPANGCSTQSCDSCGSDSFGHRLRDKLRGLFARNDCCDPCAAPKCQPVCEPKCAPACEDCCKRRLFVFHRDRGCNDSCKPACETKCVTKCEPVRCEPACCGDTCGKGPGLFSRLRGLFHRDRGCNDQCCDGGACTGGVAPKAGETITAPPKKMPGGGAKEEALNNAPPSIVPVAPAIQSAPAIAPASDATIIRNPF